jgi:hypothetical protein
LDGISLGGNSRVFYKIREIALGPTSNLQAIVVTVFTLFLGYYVYRAIQLYLR